MYQFPFWESQLIILDENPASSFVLTRHLSLSFIHLPLPDLLVYLHPTPPFLPSHIYIKGIGLPELFTGNSKKVIPKRELFQILSQAHSHGRITEKWLQEIMQKSARKLSTHPLHAQKMPNNQLQWQLQQSSL